MYEGGREREGEEVEKKKMAERIEGGRGTSKEVELSPANERSESEWVK